MDRKFSKFIRNFGWIRIILILVLILQSAPSYGVFFSDILTSNYVYVEFARRFFCSKELIKENTIRQWLANRGLKVAEFEQLAHINNFSRRKSSKFSAENSFSFILKGKPQV